MISGVCTVVKRQLICPRQLLRLGSIKITDPQRHSFATSVPVHSGGGERRETSSPNQQHEFSWKNPYTEEVITENDPVVQSLFSGLVCGQRASLARSITLVESTHPRKQAQAQVLLYLVLQRAQKLHRKTLKRTGSFRIGIPLLTLIT